MFLPPERKPDKAQGYFSEILFVLFQAFHIRRMNFLLLDKFTVNLVKNVMCILPNFGCFVFKIMQQATHLSGINTLINDSNVGLRLSVNYLFSPDTFICHRLGVLLSHVD